MQFLLKYITKPLLFLIIIFFLLLKNSFGQSLLKTDSLLTELNKAVHDTTKIKILFELGNQFLSGPSDSLLLYYQTALKIAEKNISSLEHKQERKSIKTINTYKRQTARAIIEIGIEYFFRSDYSEALNYFFKALTICEELNDISIISECNSEIGIVYKNQGNYDLALEYNEKALSGAKQTGDISWVAVCYANNGTIYLKKGYFTLALEYYLKALKTFEELGHERRICACYLNIGKIYSEQHDFNKALEYYNKALQIAYKTKDKVSETESYLNIGKVYLNMKEYSLARSYFNKSIDLYEESGYRHEMDECYKNIGLTYKMEKKYDKANEYYYRALQISRQENDKPGMAESLGYIANVFFLKHNYSKALEMAKQSLEIAKETENLQALKNAYEFLSEIYEGQNNTGKALHYYKFYSDIKDSLFSEGKYKAIREIETKFETEKKEQQLALLTEKNEVQMLKISQRNQLILALVIFFTLIVLMVYLFYRNKRLQAKHKTIQLEQQLLRSQMNPHFIFNSLIAIQSYIYKKDLIEAGDYLAKFANLVRLILENSRSEFILFEKEVNTLELYFELQLLRFENKFTYAIEIDKNIETGNISIPPMLAQPIIENAIEHGLRHKKQGGFIHIRFDKKDDSILFKVEDNGVGRLKASELKKLKKFESVAISIIKERLAILSKKYKKIFNMKITDLKDKTGTPSGTEVTFSMPSKILS